MFLFKYRFQVPSEAARLALLEFMFAEFFSLSYLNWSRRLSRSYVHKCSASKALSQKGSWLGPTEASTPNCAQLFPHN